MWLAVLKFAKMNYGYFPPQTLKCTIFFSSVCYNTLLAPYLKLMTSDLQKCCKKFWKSINSFFGFGIWTSLSLFVSAGVLEREDSISGSSSLAKAKTLYRSCINESESKSSITGKLIRHVFLPFFQLHSFLIIGIWYKMRKGVMFHLGLASENVTAKCWDSIVYQIS